jgi:hypothetical protein
MDVFLLVWSQNKPRNSVLDQNQNATKKELKYVSKYMN